MPIKITYEQALTTTEDDFLERISADAKDEGILIEEYDSTDSGLPLPVRRPKK